MSENSVVLQNKRDVTLDVFRGITAVSIIWIHTVFNSGVLYVPGGAVLNTISLLFDVPFFMFLSGWSAYYRPSLRKVIKGIINMWLFWIILVTCIDIIYYAGNIKSILGGENKIQYIFQILFQAGSRLLPNLPTFRGSLWYMPVYLTVIPIGTILLMIGKEREWEKRDYLYLMLLCIIGELYITVGIDNKFFLLSTYFWFYLYFFLLGYYVKNYDIRIKRTWILVISIVCLDILWYISAKLFGTDYRDLQTQKFPPNIIYLIASLITLSLAVFIKGRIKFKEDSFINKTLGFVGRNSFCFYFSQGIGGSSLYFVYREMIAKEILLNWRLQLFLFFLINFCISMALGCIFVAFKKILNSVGRSVQGYIKTNLYNGRRI